MTHLTRFTRFTRLTRRGLVRILCHSLFVAPLASLASCGGPQEPPPSNGGARAGAIAVPGPAPTPPVPDVPTAAPKPFPVAARRPVSETYHGVTVTDEYRWLEDGSSPDAKEWSEAENRYARGVLAVAPGRKQVHARISELLTASSADRFNLHWRGKTLFALKEQPPKQQAFLVTLKSPDDAASERVIVEPNEIDKTGKTAIDWYVPSLDGRLVAVSLSEGGSESGTVHIYDVATAKERTADAIPRVNGGTAGGSVTWNAKGTGFWYTRYPRGTERPPADLDFYQQIYFHTLGTPTKDDRYSAGKDFPRIAEVALDSSDDGRYVLATIANGDGGEFALSVLDASKPPGKDGEGAAWKPISTFADKVVHGQFGRDGNLWLLSLKDAPRGKILRLNPAQPALASAMVVVPESDVVVERFAATKTRLFVVDLVGGPSQMRLFDLQGHKVNDGKEAKTGQVPILPVSVVQQVETLEGDEVLFRNQSLLQPPGWYRYDARVGTTKKSALFKTAPADFSDAEVVRETCTSKDGTKVPITILRKKGAKLSGDHLVLLNGYGGYRLNFSPRFNVIHRVWLDQDGIFALANIRGGGEFGEAWHLDGNLTRKQHVFDDFLACAQHLIDHKYTRAGRLAIIGASNGGLLMGAALTQRPDLFAAVVSKVGIYDMLRVETTPNGAFNVTEFGTVKDQSHFQALFAYSPYHHVKDGTNYPATLFMTGANDPRVDPFHSRKMVARLQAASPTGPFLLRTSGDTGHGMGTPLTEEIDQDTDVYSFLFSRLGHTFRPSASK